MLDQLRKIEKPLLDWYEKNKRPLPWRANKNPYEIWVSEIMCQQTRVEAVKPYYARFLSALPDVKALAECPQERLMKLWEGLGYYNRVRNMQKAAQQVMESYQGELPADYDKLRSLKGIGNYTAGAIASIAYGIAAPAVDGNVLRVISRVTESYEDIAKQSVRRSVEQKLQEIMPEKCPGDYNQALMELGALICLPGAQAKCSLCPLMELCQASAHNTADKLPVKSRAKPRKIQEITVLVIQDGDRVAICKRAARGLLAGLYEFPNISRHLSQQEALEAVESMDLAPLRIQPLGEAKHIFSHVEWRMVGYQIRVQQLEDAYRGNMIFAEPEEVQDKYAIPSAFDAYASCMKREGDRRKS
ncbi:MAG: A/G-specific adenine glycosylase [Lachnospiraceae bacterium]|nr:A/G-specific adenine glycosylase [Lachnospiraceae bacterium]MCI9545675.1 A/G-specific adenine glycosylase [Lachnospiraceae bacterium]